MPEPKAAWYVQALNHVREVSDRVRRFELEAALDETHRLWQAQDPKALSALLNRLSWMSDSGSSQDWPAYLKAMDAVKSEVDRAAYV